MTYATPILVVDDSELALEMGRDLLQECGFNAVATTDPLSVEGMLRSSPIEIVLLDMLMPNKNGLEVMRDIRAIEPELGRQVMIFVITGLTDRQTALDALRAGAYFYMTKPLRREALLPSLQNCIAQLEQSRVPESMASSRGLRDRIGQARKSTARHLVLKQPQTPNAYPHPIMVVGGEDRTSGALAVPMLSHGYHVLECARPDEATVLLGSHPVDVVLLNAKMGLDSLARLCDQLRSAALALRRRLTLVVLLDKEHESWQRDLQSAGATLCMQRPVEGTSLMQTVEWGANRALGA